jgi:3-oxoacyl-[acyl-carrier protein] reductase
MQWSNVAYNFSNASVLITGGTGGLGNGIAEAFRDAGADVTITGTRGSPADYTEDLAGYRYLPLDIEDRAQIDAIAAKLPKLDILINSAGLALMMLGLDEYEPDNFERAITMHLTGVYRLAACCIPLLEKSTLPGGASIICMASMSSYFGIEHVPGYGAGKTGLLGMIRAMAVHWAKSNIRINGLAVGLARSKMTGMVFNTPALSEPMLARVPLGRHGEPADVAGAALFLSSDAASWITGQILPIDGGFSIAG